MTTTKTTPTPKTRQKSWVASSKTFTPEWFVVDATNKTLGRMATRVASVLMGKHKPTWTPFLDTGDFVIVLNAEKAKVTGKKYTERIYNTFSTYPGGRKEFTFGEWFKEHPEDVVRHAIKDMIPNNSLGRKQRSKLFVYKGDKHPHQAQQPKPLEA